MGKDVQIWQISLEVSDDTLASYFSTLSAEEKARANRFHFAADKRRFVVARGTLRHLLSRELNQRPESIAFCYGNYGKPSVENPVDSSERTTQRLQPSPIASVSTDSVSTNSVSTSSGQCNLHFNLSHSGEMALCALCYEHTVGVDIEQLKTIQRLEGMITRCFVEKEQQQINAAENPSHAFLQYWTCKEAYLKAIGLGLSQPMQTVEVQMKPPQLKRVPHSCTEGWRLHLIDLPQGYVGALVTSGNTSVNLQSWTHI